jgi:hypothetical protein
VKTVEADHDEAGDDEEDAEKDEDAAEIGHLHLQQCLGAQHCGCLAEEVRRLAGFGEDAYVAAEFAGLLTDALEVGVEACEDDDAARGEFARDVADEGEAVAAWHGDVAKEKIGEKLACTYESLVRRVGCFGVKATLREDERKSVSDQTIVVND